jgi:organic radical activating enzyme
MLPSTLPSAAARPESASSEDPLSLPLVEAFYTIQGEGVHSGKAAYFIRLAGCDVGCVWCDTRESWPMDAHPVHSVEAIVAGAARHPGRIAVVTGGEPLMHPLDPLTRALRAAGLATHLETSGAHPLSGVWDWVCLSPKKFKAPVAEAYGRADELKVVVYNRHDLVWAEEQAARVGPGCRLLLQPEWSKADTMTPAIVDYVQAHPRWQVSLQTHKYLQIR